VFPSTVLLMADYTAFPLWDRSPGGFSDIDPADLGLSDDLQNRLRAWAASYESLPMTDFEWPSPADELHFKVAGFRLAADVQQELGLDVEVLYFGGGAKPPDRQPDPGFNPAETHLYSWRAVPADDDDA
jgi:hypothetical protein